MALYQEFGKINGRKVGLYTLKNDCGVSLLATNYGCAIQSLNVPDRNGQIKDVVLGFDTLDGYVHQTYYIGTVIGRCCNRIRGAAFTLSGNRYKLSANAGRHHLHGGFQGFQNVTWETKDASGQTVHFRHVSPDGEEGYPGNLEADVIYSLTPDNEVAIEYTAVCDTDTIVNMTNHSYFNNYVLNADRGNLSEAAILVSPETGIRMRVYTTEPGLQVYTGNYLKGDIEGKNGHSYHRNAGLCLETQGFPNAVQNDSFPSVVLKKGMTFKSKTVFRFDTV